MSHLTSSQTATHDQTCQHETPAARSTICSVVGRKDSRGLEAVSKATAQALGHCVPPADTVSHLRAAQHLSMAVQMERVRRSQRRSLCVLACTAHTIR